MPWSYIFAIHELEEPESIETTKKKSSSRYGWVLLVG
jgi:hypothetical protein